MHSRANTEVFTNPPILGHSVLETSLKLETDTPETPLQQLLQSKQNASRHAPRHTK